MSASGHTNDTAVLIIVGDNGASGEGGLEGTIGYRATVQEQLARVNEFRSQSLGKSRRVGLGLGGIATFPWMKQVASHLGGTTRSADNVSAGTYQG